MTPLNSAGITTTYRFQSRLGTILAPRLEARKKTFESRIPDGIGYRGFPDTLPPTNHLNWTENGARLLELQVQASPPKRFRIGIGALTGLAGGGGGLAAVISLLETIAYLPTGIGLAAGTAAGLAIGWRLIGSRLDRRFLTVSDRHLRHYAEEIEKKYETAMGFTALQIAEVARNSDEAKISALNLVKTFALYDPLSLKEYYGQLSLLENHFRTTAIKNAITDNLIRELNSTGLYTEEAIQILTAIYKPSAPSSQSRR